MSSSVEVANIRVSEDEFPSVDVREFRKALAHLASGVALVTSTRQGHDCGLTATWFAPVAFDPPLLLVSLGVRAATASGIDQSRAFGVSVLRSSCMHGDLARRFSTPGSDTKFRGVPFRAGMSGLALLEEAVVCMECALWDTYRAGDHVLYLGRVVATNVLEGTEPLVHHMGRYRSLGIDDEVSASVIRLPRADASGSADSILAAPGKRVPSSGVGDNRRSAPIPIPGHGTVHSSEGPYER